MEAKQELDAKFSKGRWVLIRNKYRWQVGILHNNFSAWGGWTVKLLDSPRQTTAYPNEITLLPEGQEWTVEDAVRHLGLMR